MPGAFEQRSCSACRRRDRWHGYADETIRNGRYGIPVAIECACRLQEQRRMARSMLLPRQYRLHMAKEQPSRRRLILSAIRRSGLRALHAEARGKQHAARSDYWTTVVPRLLELGVSRLDIEQTNGCEQVDKTSISDALAKADSMRQHQYAHQSHRAEPILWLADAVAWAAGHRGEWRMAISGILLDT